MKTNFKNDRPVLFSAPMVRAILDGTKTQTRRIVKGVRNDNSMVIKKGTKTKMGVTTHVIHAFNYGLCPYGSTGDRLWVRENIAFGKGYDGQHPVDIPTGNPAVKAFYMADGLKPEWAGQIRPSIHMPRAWSRLLLEITDVRVERLQEITEKDARAEGCPERDFDTYPRQWFENLWCEINGAESWIANPWVWVVEFKVLP